MSPTETSPAWEWVASAIKFDARVYCGLLLVVVVPSFLLAMASWMPTSRPPLTCRRTRRHCTVGHWGWRRSIGWATEQLDPQLCATATINHRDAASIDAACVHKVILGTVRSSKALAFISTV